MSGSSDQHISVMLAPALAALRIDPDGQYLDATFGRGGHAAAIREQLRAGMLTVIDQDPTAISVAQQRYGDDPQVNIEHCNFDTLSQVARRHGPFNGILFDLGVSSPQLDDGERGFSFMHDGPLDMRMNPDQGISVAQWLASASVDTITTVLKDFGEERFAKRIAQRIVSARQQQRIETTAQLASLIAASVPRSPREQKHPATRSFQALRVFINRELDVLQPALEAAIDALLTGGRLVVIAFHSLEDRIVKRTLRAAALPPPASRRLPTVPFTPRLKLIGKAHRPSAQETTNNPRARSAIMRVAERVAA